MRTIGKILGVVAGAVALGGTTPALAQARCPAPPTPQSTMARQPAPMLLANRYVEEKKAPGIVIAWACGDINPTIIANGSVAAEAGAADVSPDTLWRVYSMTKPITGMAAMLLIEDGKLRLDQPIAEIIPAFKNMTVLTDPASGLASRPTRTAITVRHLLTHTAGLGYSIVTKGPLLKEYERLGILPGAVNAQMEAQMAAVRPKSLLEFANRTASLPLIAEPGTQWSYSIGLDVLAAVIEVASGMSFEAFLETRMFGPLGMESTFWSVPASDVKRFASNYAFVGDNIVPFDPAAASVYLQPPSFPYGGAGLVMSAKDYDRFLRMLLAGGTLDGKRVMQAETVRIGMSNLLPDGVTFDGVDGGAQRPRMGFGAGGSVFLQDAPGGFPSKGTYGWGGAAGTIAWVDPGNGVRGTVMVNYFPSDKWPLRADVTQAVYSELKR